MQYVDTVYYKEIFEGIDLGKTTDKMLKLSCLDIDTLTYNRIKAKGFENLTDFQKETIMLSVCLHAEFTQQYGEMLNSPIAGYSAGSTSVSFSAKNIHSQSGVNTTSRVMGLLAQTGLTTGLFI